MASKTDQLLVVVSILQGRHFPKSPSLQLVVQASFNGELLDTDPAEHREQPLFNNELAWELDRKTLHQHRLQRTPIKLHCFAVDSVSKKRESVGYTVLDLRSVQEAKQEPRWYPLLNSKYNKQKPALLLSLVLENDTKPRKPSPDPFKATKAPPRQGSSSVTDLEAVLIPQKGFYRVGPADRCTDMFILSVTLAFPSKLEQLIPTSMKLSSVGSEFFFYYSLLGSDVTSEPFHSLLSPDFEPDRAYVRIHSNKHILRLFLSQQPCLQVHLCCGIHCLGSADVPFLALSAASVDLEKEAAILEGAFPLHSPKVKAQPQNPLPVELQTTVGVAVTLRREQSATKEDERGPLQSPSAPQSDQRPQSSSPDLKHPNSSTHPTGPPFCPPSSHTESEAESLLEDLTCVCVCVCAATDLEVSAQRHSQPDAATSISVSAPKVAVPSSSHHFCFSLDLCSLRNLSLSHPIAASLRYSYPFFGSAAPIMTSPPVELQRNMEVSFSKSYCAFEFATLPHQLQDTFNRVPLVVEVWHRDSMSRDQLIGRASIQMSLLLSSERCSFLRSTGQQCWRQTVQDQIAVVGTQCPNEKVAELRYMASLEDLGLVNIREVTVSDSSQVGLNISRFTYWCVSVEPPKTPLVPQSSRDTVEYQTALELGLWKKEQEELFDDQLRKKEHRHMQALAEEWRRRDKEREAVVQKKEVEYNRLEEQLQKTLADLERREKQLVEAELETRRLQREIRAEHGLAQRELQERSRRQLQECDHRVALEKDKVHLMEEERARLLQQITEGDSRYKQLEKEFSLYREQQNTRPEFRLQTEINLLTLEKVELERKLESTTKSKLHYKQQWGRALKELAHFKQREQENAMILLKKQQAELAAMRLRYIATEEKEAVQQDRKELDSIRNDLNGLKEQNRMDPTHSVSEPVPGLSQNASADEHLSRLLEERDTLLRTGVYTHQDRIIAELNRQIQDAIKDQPETVRVMLPNQ
uniref:Centrosomal protein of 120 kDa-like n=1 Tax=Gouania willdenowi TaxID=441366 RepID=A0A8C5H4Y1_GOUWI